MNFYEDIIAAQKARDAEIADLRALVKEWLCVGCRTVYPGPPQPGFSCVICPKCDGDCGPHELMVHREEIADLRAKLAKDEQWAEELCSVLQRRGDEIADLRAKLAAAEKDNAELDEYIDGLISDREYLEAKLADAEQRTICGVCGGQPPVSGLTCICDGTGLAQDEALNARKMLHTAEQRIVSLEEAQAIRFKALRDAEQSITEWKARYHAVKECQEAWVKRAREAEVKGLEKARSVILDTGHLEFIDREIARLKAEKGEG